MPQIFDSNIFIHLHNLTKFHRCIFLMGFLTGDKTEIVNIKCSSKYLVSYVKTLSTEQNEHKFEIQILLSESIFPEDLTIKFKFRKRKDLLLTASELQSCTCSLGIKDRLWNNFLNFINQNEGYDKILDIGGRARSGTQRSLDFPNKQVTVLDIVQADGVDVVCDAHCMSTVLGKNYFDAVYSISVFEHLIMPWKVAVEINRVLRVGGIAFILSHQSVGMHEIPWDYYRFSDTAWKGLFNKDTGFEIIDSGLDQFMFVIPFNYAQRYKDVEKSAGYEASAVLIRKIGESSIDWPLAAKDIINDFYPLNEINRTTSTDH